MNRIFYNTLIFICALFIGWVTVVFSIRPTQEVVDPVQSQKDIVWSKISLKSQWDNTYKVDSEIIDIEVVKVSQNTPMLIDFWRLSSFLYLAPTWSQNDVLTKSGSTGIVIGKVSGIVSLYDLFLSYSVYDKDNTFRLEQLTNGSFYVGKEKDEKIALYAIDGVVRLTFIHAGEDMTSLILFPGSYIRFDPTRNRSLKNADLFRTILSLKDTDNEVFEFVNPRVNIGDEQDAFFNYRLPVSSIALFRALSSRFKEKVDTNTIRNKYWFYNEFKAESSWLMNPSKINHNMLMELWFLLTKALDARDSSDEVIGKIGTLYNQAKSLDLKNSSAKNLVEQFLLDGRFAVYGGVSNPRYQQTYENIAKMIGIERTDAKSQLFQTLADIYSRNLFSQKTVDSRVTINTYIPTALELAKTFDKDQIESKDYFDIAIYAFNILRKMEEKKLILIDTAMEDPATYSYLMTFFRASNRYIESIDNREKKQQTIMSFSRQFYDYTIALIVNSIYRTYVTSEDGWIFLHSRFRDGIKVTIPEELLRDINTLNDTIKAISPSIESMWSASWKTDTDTFRRITHNITKLDAFSTLINPEKYKDYIKTPFKLDPESNKDIPLPFIDAETSKPVRLDSASVENIKNTKALSTDPRIQEIKKIWTDADASSLSIEGEDIRIRKASYKLWRSGAGNSNLAMSALYKDKNFSDILIFYDDYTIEVVIDKQMSFEAFKAFLLQLESYLDFIDSELIARWSDVFSVRIFPARQRINIWDSLYPVSIKNN